MGKSQNKREQILEIAERAVLAKGFGATSIEEIYCRGWYYKIRLLLPF